MEELQVEDNQGVLLNYFKRISASGELVLDYSLFIAGCPQFKDKDLGEYWSEIINSYRVYTKINGDSAPYSVFLRGYPFNHISIADLRNKHVKKIVVVEGLVKKISVPKEQMISSVWACACSPSKKIYMDGLRKPGKCASCGSEKKYDLLTEDCIYQDVQWFVLQEVNPGAHQPKMIKCRATGSLVDSLQAGNHCTVTGLVRVEVDKDFVGELWLDVIDCQIPDAEYIDVEITNEDELTIKELSKRPTIYKDLCDSINPAIWGYDEIKLALVLQMFGGVTVDESQTNAERVRGDSHILLCGDPSLAKSQLIRSVSKIVPRCVYTSGKSSSAAGLTVSAHRDEQTGQWTLEAGALVLANGAFCVIDELDKMSDNDRSALHEAMESQSISVAKAGINQTLQTACPLLCAANPKFGRFASELPTIEQINLPPALMSRFDLIFMLIDTPNSVNDSKVADRVLNNTDVVLSGGLERPISIDLLRKYLIYARRINPAIPDSVKKILHDKYVEVRSQDGSKITVRQLHALIRLTQSSARVGLRTECNEEDVNRAISLFEFAMNTVTLGKGIDVSLFDSKCSIAELSRIDSVLNVVRNNPECDLAELSRIAMQDYRIEVEEFNDIMLDLLSRRFIHLENGNYVIS